MMKNTIAFASKLAMAISVASIHVSCASPPKPGSQAATVASQSEAYARTPATVASQTEAYARMPATKESYIFAGDEIVRAYSWRDHVRVVGGPGSLVPILNRGVDGETTANLVKRLPELKRHRRPGKFESLASLFVLEGANDIDAGIPAKTIVANLDKVAASHAEGSIYIFGILPVEARFQHHNKVAEEVNKLLAAHQSIWLKKGYNACYLAPPTYYSPLGETTDGVHPNLKGYEMLGDALPLPVF